MFTWTASDRRRVSSKVMDVVLVLVARLPVSIWYVRPRTSGLGKTR